jgi:hypothetical protein
MPLNPLQNMSRKPRCDLTVKAPCKDSALAAVLRNLKPIVGRYLEKLNNHDNVWSYTERPWVGFLAGAAWHTPDVIALEEFETQKHRDDGEDGYGRSDLWLGIGDTQYFIEAKWTSLHVRSGGLRPGDSCKNVRAKFRSACRAAKSNAVPQEAVFKNWKQIGLCFVSPAFADKPDRSRFDQLRRNLNSQFKQHLAAWLYSPKGCPDEGDSGPFRRGMLLLAREVGNSHGGWLGKP